MIDIEALRRAYRQRDKDKSEAGAKSEVPPPRVDIYTCPKCGAAKIHCRLRGYICLICGG